jgi:hypothetical protein
MRLKKNWVLVIEDQKAGFKEEGNEGGPSAAVG